MNNPYGAVPEALRDTRYSLRDIMADILATKKMEGDLSLARAKADTETALVQAGIERDRLANEKDVSRMNMQADQFNRQIDQSDAHFQKNFSLAEAAQRFTQGPAFDETKRVNTSAINLHDAQTGELTRKAKEENQILTAQQYATERGAAHLLPIFGLDPNMKMTRKQFDGFGNQVDAMIKNNPMINVIFSGKKLQSDLEALSAQYKTPGLDKSTKDRLGQEIKGKRELLEKMDFFIMAAKEPDPVKVAAEAHKTWTDNPDLATQYKTYDDYHQAFANSIRTARGYFHDGINQMKFFEATKDISPTYLEDLQAASSLVSAMPDKAKAQKILDHGKKLLSSGKYQEAHEYMTSWENHLSSPNPQGQLSTAGSPSLSDAAKQVSQTNIARMRQTVSPEQEAQEIQSLIDYKMRQSKIPTDSPQYSRALQLAREQAEKEVRPRYIRLRDITEQHIAQYGGD